MKHYVIKTVVGQMNLDIFIMSEASAAELAMTFLEASGIAGPPGWISSSCIIAVLDCAEVGIKPPQKGSTVVPFKLVGGKDDAGRGGEGEAAGIPEKPGA